MRRTSLLMLTGLLWLLASGGALAATAPAKVVQQFIDAHLQGRFVEARGLTIEQVQLSASLFSNWLFGAGANGGEAATADVFLSRKFAQVFRYTIIGTIPSGENLNHVTVMRTSPNLVHMYTWALAPKRAAAPYELIEAIDTYLTKVNFPLEESRMQFTLVREVDAWYISAIHDEKFVQLQQQWLSRPPAPAVATPTMPPPPMVGTATPGTPATTTVSSDDPGRQMADAQFNATLQSFNRPHQPPSASGASQAIPEEEKPSFLDKVAGLFKFGGKSKTTVKLSDASLKKTFDDIRDALARYSITNGGSVPASGQIYDWKSLRQLVNEYAKRPLPATEAEVGFTFVRYSADLGIADYVLLLELHEPRDGVRRIEVTPYGVDRAG